MAVDLIEDATASVVAIFVACEPLLQLLAPPLRAICLAEFVSFHRFIYSQVDQFSLRLYRYTTQ